MAEVDAVQSADEAANGMALATRNMVDVAALVTNVLTFLTCAPRIRSRIAHLKP
jgi:hypothetical protein